ncbi:hypothetical protein DRQ25_17060 [Candidatus Fermentibacteria bacterium]|nr:MAG: hypothetical protein DRQ25_17060 [Candidatus Fermentibacteria bacterium]
MEYQLSIRENIMNQLKPLTVRLPEKAIRVMKAIAESQYLPTRTLIRAWIMQRLEAERLNRIIPAAGGELGGTTPSAGAQHPLAWSVCNES